MSSRWADGDAPRGDDYDRRWDDLAASGQNPHGEADLVVRYDPSSVLDAGCGTGRLAIELARRDIDVVGVDLDDAMLTTARTKAPELVWLTADLATFEVDRTFDVVALAGNVMIFVRPGTEAAVVQRCRDHLRPEGRLIAGFQLAPGRLTLETYDEHAAAAGLVLEDRFATWSGDPFVAGGDYAVSVHRLV